MMSLHPIEKLTSDSFGGKFTELKEIESGANDITCIFTTPKFRHSYCPLPLLMQEKESN
jgi:hypothetical protein